MFDTSAVNRLADDPHSSALIAGLRSGFFIRVTTTSFEEIIATPSPKRRADLMDWFRRLSSGDNILPFNSLLEEHLAAFKKNSRYQWLDLDVFPLVLHDFIVRQEDINDKLAEEQLVQARELQEQFEAPFKSIRRHFED